MKKRDFTKELVKSGLLLAIGILLPMVFHIFSMTGPIFLPMHIPVLIGGFLLSPTLALVLGIITPLISSVLTGMPVIFPMGPIMAIELGTYGLIASLTYRKLKLSVIPSLIIAMLAGRIAAGLTVTVLVQLFSVKMNPITFVQGAVLTGIPGIIIQIVLIPSLIYALRHYNKNK